MLVRPRTSSHEGWVSTAASTWRLAFQRFSFVLFLLLSLALLLLNHSQPVLVENVRARVVDGLAPVLAVVMRPVEFTENAVRRAASYFDLREENIRLRAENERLLQWQNAAQALEKENRELQSLLHYKPEPAASYISARVIGDTGGPFVRSLIVTAGRVDGVREGMAAMTGEGLIGRVIEAGNWSSRILLITDLNSRIPVVIAENGDHAILAGDNAARPKLLYLPPDASLQVGMRVLTSGHGGIFPPNLPVAVVSGLSRKGVEITPTADLGRINQVRLVDFDLKGGIFNPLAQTLRAH